MKQTQLVEKKNKRDKIECYSIKIIIVKIAFAKGQSNTKKNTKTLKEN